MNQRSARQPRRLRSSPTLLVGPFIVLACMAAVSSAQQRVLKLVDIKQDPPCSAWGTITSCAPHGGAITWGGAYSTTYTWTVPPDEIGPDGVTISLTATENNPSEHRSATGLRLTASGFEPAGDKPDIPIGAPGQPMSGSARVRLKPQPGAGEYSIRIGVYWGPGFTYNYRAQAPTKEKTAEASGNSALSNAARSAIADPNFQMQPGKCSGFVDRIVRRVYGQKYAKLFGLSAKVTYANFKTNGLLTNPQELKPGDILFQPTLGNYGHIAIFVGDGVIAEDGCSGKTYRTVNAFGRYQAVGRLPPP